MQEILEKRKLEASVSEPEEEEFAREESEE
jgi:hypothetical protein